MGNLWSVGIFSVPKDYHFDQPIDCMVNIFNARKLRLQKQHVHTYADPFLFEHEGFLYIFLEIQEIGGKGFINCWRTRDLKDWSDLGCILKEPFHLSYPFVFKDQATERIYLLPESAEVKKIFLYEFESFPDKLVRKTVIINGNYADTNIIYLNGVYFLGTLNQDTDQFQVFFAENLAGPWTEHPMNPVQTNFPRNGGGFFIVKNKLYRAAQNTKHHYGEGIVILEVKELTKNSYSELLIIHDLRPFQNFSWQKKGRHHFSLVNFDGQKIIAIDGLQKDYLINKFLNSIFKFIR